MRNHTLVVDTPADAGGADSAPMPPELVATALGTCIGVHVVRACQQQGLPTEGLTITTEWSKSLGPMRIGALAVRVEVPTALSETQRVALSAAAEQCMVYVTLAHHQPTVSITVDTPAPVVAAP
jgi:uncharacterized OsmC-like protein